MVSYTLQQRRSDSFGIGLRVLPFGKGDSAKPPPALGAHAPARRIKTDMRSADDPVAIKRLYVGKIDGRGRYNPRARCRTLDIRNREPFFFGQWMCRIEPKAPAPDTDPILALRVAAASNAIGKGERDGNSNTPS